MEVKKQLQNIQFVHIQVTNWYDVKFNNVRRNPENFPEWKIENDCLYYHRPDPFKSILEDENEWKTVVREPEILGILQRNHEEPDAGHLGRNKMYERLRVKYYWPSMFKDVEDFVEACEVCKKVKYNQRASQAPHQTRQPIKP